MPGPARAGRHRARSIAPVPAPAPPEARAPLRSAGAAPAAPKAARTAALVAIALAAFAANSLLCRAALDGGAIDAVSFTTLRLGSGALVLALLARATAPPHEGSWRAALWLFAYAICFSLAYGSIAVGTGALLLFGAVQLTMLLAGLRAGERPAARTWTGLAAAAAGLVLLVAPGIGAPDPLGAALMVVAGAAWGRYSLCGRGSTAPLRGNAANFARCVSLAIVASLVALPLHGAAITPRGAALAVASGALASGIGYAIWYAALPHLSATRAAVVQLAVPPLAAFAGVVLLGERADARLLSATAVILGGVLLAVTAPLRPPRASPPPTQSTGPGCVQTAHSPRVRSSP